ncbi:MAG: ATP-binding protein [Clostridia bacterium]|nr:ATP-binding protein [Clostridia bacterium]
MNNTLDRIGEKKNMLTKQENALDLPQIKAEIGRLYLSAASTYLTLINLAREDKAVEEKLISFTSKKDIVDILSKRTDTCFQNAKKYGSSIKSGTPTTTLDDIKGQENVKAIVRSFVFLAKHPSLFDIYKIKGGLGLMMYGAPGTGKTMFAEAIANEMQLPLFVITPADLFKSYVGASEQAVRQIFDDISAFSDGAILFVDECESIFSRRDKDTKDYKSAVTSELLQRMNGEGVDGSRRIMIAATNRPWDIDPAYLRYKRFSHMIHITPPDSEAIEAIVTSKLKGIPVEDGVLEYTLAAIERKLNPPGGERRYCSSADICGIVENACRMAVEEVMIINKKDSEDLQYVKVSKDMIRKAIDAFKPNLTEADKRLYDEFTPEAMQKGGN